MPNRGELPIPSVRVKSVADSGKHNPDAEAWAVIAFCTIGWLMSFYFALATIGTDAFPKLMSQIPWG